MCTTHTHTHPHTRHYVFLFSSRGDVHKNDARVLSDLFVKFFFSVEWGGGVGYGEFSKGCNSPEGGPLASQHCFALLNVVFS